MLKSYLIDASPPTKFILIEDNLEIKGKDILRYLTKNHLQQGRKIDYFVSEGVFNSTKEQFSDINVYFHNCVSNNESNRLESAILNLDTSKVVVLDSLAQVIIQHGVEKTYRMCHELCNNKNVLQLISVLHLDVLVEPNKTTKYFENLATCFVKLQPKASSENLRVLYTYKKSGGKIISALEEYKFENGALITQKIKKKDSKVLVQETSTNEIIPDKMTTFKISLDDKEKQARDELVLPYLPKSEADKKSGESNIFYKFDNVDDWDEEDPDDDLDI